MIKAIETVWKGHRFRSRLEARWAVFFDALGIRWEYETQGFEREGLRYLPDFRIHGVSASYWVEVKGDPDWIRKDKTNLIKMHGEEGMLPDFAGSGAREITSDGLIVLGEVPEITQGVMVVPVICNKEAKAFIKWHVLICGENSLHLIPADEIMHFFFWHPHVAELTDDMPDAAMDFQVRIADVPQYYGQVIEAAQRARGARFEFGARQ